MELDKKIDKYKRLLNILKENKKLDSNDGYPYDLDIKNTKLYLKDLESLQPTLFKVATEDSPEVLVEPEKHHFMKSGFDVHKCKEIDYLIESDAIYYDVAAYRAALATYDKAPSISEDRLELNKANATIKVLEKDSNLGFVMLYNTHRREEERLKSEIEKLNKVILNHLEIESSNGRTFKSMSLELTEANKQLNEYKEVVDSMPNLVKLIKMFINGDIKIEVGEYPKEVEIIEELLSKLNKD